MREQTQVEKYCELLSMLKVVLRQILWVKMYLCGQKAMKAEELYSQLLGIASPWEISDVQLSALDSSVTVHLSHASGLEFACPTCGDSCCVYDHCPERTWRHLDTCQYYTYLRARLPRVHCPKCGIQQVATSWCMPHSRYTLLFTSYAVSCLRNSQVIARTAQQLRLSERQLSYLLRKVVDKGLNERVVSTEECKYLAIDEKSCRKGHNYVPIIYSHHSGRVLAVAEDRTLESVKKAYEEALKGTPADQTAAVSIFFDVWNEKAIQLANAPLQKVATMFKEHLNGLISYAKHPISNAIAEGTNSIIQQIKAKARGFKSAKAFKYAILFYCGQLYPYPQNLS